MDQKTTTAGALLIKSMLPTKEARDNYDLYRPLDKGGIKALVNNLIEHGGDKSHETINDLAKLFFNKATEIGATTPLSDYVNDSPEREAIIQEFEVKVGHVLNDPSLSRQEKANELNSLAFQYGKGKLSKQNLEYLVGRGSTAARMAMTGARGNPMQLQQGTASPLMALDVKNNPIPLVIHHSFAEGLTNAEHLAMSYGGRASTVLSQLSTSLPGALFKKLTPAVMHEVITETDCGSKTGVPTSTADKLSCIGRFEAKTNREITPAYLKELVGANKKEVLARSPLTCQAKSGLCQKCYGLAANGHLPEIGFNVGVIASQSVSEVLTQAMLSTKHQGGVAGRSRNPYEEASNLLVNPQQNFFDEATLATKNGTVTSIKETALKDHEIYVGDVKHYVPNIQKVNVLVGDEVKVGDSLSTGTINPRQLTSLVGIGAGRVLLAKELRKVYSRDTDLDPRHFDVIARNLIKYVKVEDPGESGFLPGDKIDIGQLQKHLMEDSKDIPIVGAEGKLLAKQTLEITPGTTLTKNHLDYLSSNGVTSVPVSSSDIKVTPLVPGLNMMKLLDKNWVSKLAFNHLSDTIRSAAALGQSSQVHSNDPIAAYMMGTDFGEGEHGKY